MLSGRLYGYAFRSAGSSLGQGSRQRLLLCISTPFTDVKRLSTFKYSGRIDDADPTHTPVTYSQITKLAKEKGISIPSEQELTPLQEKGAPVEGPILTLLQADPKYPTNWFWSLWGVIPQYGNPAVKQAGTLTKWDPNSDCNGNFMASKWKPNNNCYAYACDMATNTYAQPGRSNGGLPFTDQTTAETIRRYANRDGLETADPDSLTREDGHTVALLFAKPDASVGFKGDYHWVRYDQKQKQWSQKNGGDQITHFDFAGNPIADPLKANWSLNMGRLGNNDMEYVITYEFYCLMFVPDRGVRIL